MPIRTKPDPKEIEKAAQILLQARQPFMLVGIDVWRCDAYDEVLQLAELLGMQVVQGLSPYTDFPTDHPLHVGRSAVRLTAAQLEVVRAADLTRPEWQDRVSDAEMKQTIRKGRNRMPAFDLPPAVIAVTAVALARPRTATGAELSMVVPLPSWPLSPCPQHHAPPLSAAHVW